MASLPAMHASAAEYRRGIVERRYSARDGTERFLRALARVDSKTHALLEVLPEDALRHAEAVDAYLARGSPPRALEGVLFTAKSLIATCAGTTNAGSRILEGYRSPYDATAVRRLLDAGAILVGKTNLDEFGMGSSTENSAFHPTRNPWDLERVPGGSSGGAAALAGSLGWSFHLGTDTGGSIRQPAALCSASGMKPTYGLVSRYGLLAFGSSLDQIGPLARSAEDVMLALDAMAGEDPLDATSRPGRPHLSASGARARRIGIPREYFGAGIDAGVARRVEEAIEILAADGVERREVSLPHTRYANACYQVVATAEASSNLARYDGIHYGVRHAGSTGDATSVYRTSRGRGFGAEVQRRILLGTFVLSAGYYDAYYKRALQVRRLLRRDFERAFDQVDLLVCPTSPIPPFRIGEKVTDPLALYACDILTVPASLAGMPGISIPCGLDAAGLPVGLQIIGPLGGDATVLRLARRFQELTDHHVRVPEGIADAS